jgi:hypothetical protein
MSLDWDATKCGSAWKKLHPEVQTVMVFGCISTGIGKITKENYHKWAARLQVMDDVYHVTGIRPTLEEIKAAIGLSTNVFPDETDAIWAKRFTRVVEDRVWRLKDSEEDDDGES